MLQLVRHDQADRAAPTEAELEQAQVVAEAVDLVLTVTRVEQHAEQACRTAGRVVFTQGPPLCMAR